MRDNPTSYLVGDYSTERREMMSTIRKTPLVSEKIMKEASQLATLRDMQTPLQK